MKSEFEEYCNSIGMGATLIEVVRACYLDCEKLVPKDPILDIFISEHVTQEGSRQYETLHFFTAKCILEVLHFVSSPIIWMTGYAPMHLELTKSSFDFVTSSKDSRAKVRAIWVTGDFHIDPTASAENCDRLISIVNKYLIPHVE